MEKLASQIAVKPTSGEQYSEFKFALAADKGTVKPVTIKIIKRNSDETGYTNLASYRNLKGKDYFIYTKSMNQIGDRTLIFIDGNNNEINRVDFTVIRKDEIHDDYKVIGKGNNTSFYEECGKKVFQEITKSIETYTPGSIINVENIKYNGNIRKYGWSPKGSIINSAGFKINGKEIELNSYSNGGVRKTDNSQSDLVWCRDLLEDYYKKLGFTNTQTGNGEECAQLVSTKGSIIINGKSFSFKYNDADKASEMPIPGSVISFKKNLPDMPDGHVGIVKNSEMIDCNTVRITIIDQNNNNTKEKSENIETYYELKRGDDGLWTNKDGQFKIKGWSNLKPD